MKDLFKFGLTLALICFICAGLLAAVNNATEDLILQKKTQDKNEALEGLFPEAEKFDIIEEADKTIYLALDKDKKILGYAFHTTGKGYSSDIESMVALDLDSNIINVKILSQNETPGLGAKITEATFWERFRGVRLKEDLEVDTISGATISSSALIKSIEKDAAAIKELANNRIKNNGR